GSDSGKGLKRIEDAPQATGLGFPNILYPRYPSRAMARRTRDQNVAWRRNNSTGRYVFQSPPCLRVSCFRPAPFQNAWRAKSYAERRVRWYTMASGLYRILWPAATARRFRSISSAVTNQESNPPRERNIARS